MLKVLEPINNRVYYIPEGEDAPIDICVEGYRLENGINVQYIGCKWLDFKDKEYTPIYADNEIVGFILKQAEK